MNWRILAKFLSKELPAEGHKKMEASLRKNPSEKRLTKEIMQWWPQHISKNGLHLSDEEKRHAWDEIHSAIGETSVSPVPLKAWGFGIAASLSLLLIAYLLWPSNQKVTTTVAQKSEIGLSDGSTVFLNHSSSLKYKKSFGEDSRVVQLRGEAFFEVKKNPGLPFVVNTGGTSVSVLGTSFNILSREKLNTVEVTVVTGKVLFSKGSEEETIFPGETGIYNRTDGSLYKVPQEGLNSTAWHSGKLVFKSAAFSEIEKTLENLFNVDIRVNDQAIYKCSVTSVIHFDGLQDVLEVLQLTMGFEYETDMDNIQISGDGCN